MTRPDKFDKLGCHSHRVVFDATTLAGVIYFD